MTATRPGFTTATAGPLSPPVDDPLNPGFKTFRYKNANGTTDVLVIDQDGVLAYRQPVNADGTLGAPAYDPAYAKPGQDIPTPDGPRFRRTDGEIFDPDPSKIDISHYTPQQAVADIQAGNTTLREDVEKAKTFSEQFNLVKMITGKDAPGFSNNQINRIIDKGLGGDGTTFGGVPNPGTVVLPGGAGGAGAGGTGTGTGGNIDLAGLSQEFLNAYRNAQEHPSPQATAALAQAIQAAGGPQVVAAQAAGPGAVTAAQAQGPGAVTAAQAQAAQAAGIPAVVAAQMTPAQIAAYVAAQKYGPIQAGFATAGHSTAATIDPAVAAKLAKFDTSDELAARQKQDELVAALEGAIAGKDPSAAAILLRQATDRNIANQYALAASAHGMNSGLAERQAMIGVADLNAKAAADNAILRAKEIEAARSELAGVLGTQRAADINVATTTYTGEQGVNSDLAKAINARATEQAQLTTQSRIQNAANDTTTSGTNARNITDVNTTGAQLANAIEIANANNRTSISEKQADLNQDASKTNVTQLNDINNRNADRSLDLNKFNTGQLNDISKYNTGQLNDVNNRNADRTLDLNKYNTGQLNDVSNRNADRTLDLNKYNTGQLNDVSKFNSSQIQDVNKFNTGEVNDISATNATNQTSTNQSNVTAALRQAEADALARQNAAKNALDASGQVIQGNTAAANTALAYAKLKMDQDNADNQLLTGLGTKLFSDARGKKGIRNADDEARELVRAISAKSFSYKDADAPGAMDGENLGILAQDLERSEAGRRIVSDTPHGKMVDKDKALMAALAALGSMDKRISKIERRT